MNCCNNATLGSACPSPAAAGRCPGHAVSQKRGGKQRGARPPATTPSPSSPLGFVVRTAVPACPPLSEAGFLVRGFLGENLARLRRDTCSGPDLSSPAHLHGPLPSSPPSPPRERAATGRHFWSPCQVPAAQGTPGSRSRPHLRRPWGEGFLCFLSLPSSCYIPLPLHF